MVLRTTERIIWFAKCKRITLQIELMILTLRELKRLATRRAQSELLRIHQLKIGLTTIYMVVKKMV